MMRYVVGFLGSLLLTIAAYLLVTMTNLSGGVLVALIVALAIIQLVLQLVCFLHLGEGHGGRTRAYMFIAMAGVLLILVFGSIWIMNNLNYHMMSPEAAHKHMMVERDKGF